MTEFFVVYRNVEDWQDMPEFELKHEPKPGEMVIREQVIPGAFGYKDIYVRHYHRHIKRDAINLITYTHAELKPSEVRRIANRALQWAKNQ